jgi:protein TonB
MAVLPGQSQERMSEAYQGASPNSRFLAGDISGDRASGTRFGNAAIISAATHAFILFLVLFALTAPQVLGPVTNVLPPEIVWLQQPGPGGGGGGGGNRMPDPPRKAELPGVEKITVPVTKPPKIEKIEPPKDVPNPPLTIPAQPTASAVQELPGAISAAPVLPTPSQGSGTGGGSGTGTGTGMGPGQGSGLGPGFGGGSGGGAYHPGNGVTSPELIKEVKPTYTGEAMRAKIQGMVTMEAVVMPDGSVGQVKITRSLDDRFGLDQEAINTVRKWRFKPGMRLGVPVPVLVEIEMQFTLR